MIKSPVPANQTMAIFGRYILAEHDGKQTIMRDQWVVCEADRIKAITPSRPHDVDLLLDRPGQFILPGLMNLHNHCFSEAIARTHTEDGAARENDQSIVYSVLLPLSKKGIDILSSQERLDVARLGILQLLKGGSTTVMEPFRHGIAEMFEAAMEMGIRFYGAPYLFSGDDPQSDAMGDDKYTDLERWNALYTQWHGGDGGRIQLAMSPHATDTCDPDLLRAAHARACELDVSLTIHLAQSADEVAQVGRKYQGRTPAQYLDWLGLLKPRLLAAHCIASSDSDVDLMAQRGVTVLNCPRVFARAGKTAAFSRFADKGLRTLVATDGYNMDLLGELNAAALISKISTGNAKTASAGALIAAVTSQAAASIGREDLGIIRTGAKADLTIVDLSHPHLQPIFDPCKALIWLANRANISTVIVDGRVLMEKGHYGGGDEEKIVAAGVAAIEKIWQLPEARAAFAS